ncbi:OLC1v1022445C1 [Oldenlandia corymbosa var. corymbosa]|uniref:OLC1v1022445C1 n=1 Tax=Oldenlandia corymbosa var. corymbosa TaxID=529605 RepID=A0AAV1BXX1_OLDCO|nr:OLC1v1022445C1 [Oldenlandia corymbosa var. corymbosa]
MAEVSEICKCTMVSTKGVDVGRFCSLSALDHVMEHNHLRIVLYYSTPKEIKLGEPTKMLKESLSQALCAYPIVTGRLLRDPEKGNWMIKSNDAGVRMVEMRAQGNVEKWLQNVDSEKELKLVYWEHMFTKPYFWSPFYIQITEFEEGGLAIGLSCTHLLSDPISAVMFMKSWAHMTVKGTMPSPLLYRPIKTLRKSDQTSHGHCHGNLSNGLIEHYKSTLRKPIAAGISEKKLTTVSLAFSDQMVRSCISAASSDVLLRPPTPFEALAGLFWTSISKIKGRRENGLIDMSVCLDMRKVLDLDENFFGNCMVYSKASSDGLGGTNELSEAVAGIEKVVDKMDAKTTMELIEWLEEATAKHISPPLMNGLDLICANLEDVDTYSAIFCPNFKPILASFYIEPTAGEGSILVLPAPPDAGPFSRIVMITLAEDEAIELLKDESIQQFSPKVLMKMAEKKL